MINISSLLTHAKTKKIQWKFMKIAKEDRSSVIEKNSSLASFSIFKEYSHRLAHSCILKDLVIFCGKYQ